MNEDKLEKYFKDGMSDPTAKSFFEKMLEWKRRNGLAYRELKSMLKNAEDKKFV